MESGDMNHGNLAFVMEEIFSGHLQGCTFLDDGDPAVIGLLKSTGAQEASRRAAGSSLAAQARHLLFSIDAYTQAIRTGEESHIAENWPEWDDSAVSDEEWRAMLELLESKAGRFVNSLRSRSGEEPSRLALGALAHMAFHLGVIMTKYDLLKQEGDKRP